ncbi:MAG: SAM-dependent methyltransferase [Streptomyces oryziradicis]|nr:SAM-dependent methyltransferase [Actinacidiphila oryziradicis]
MLGGYVGDDEHLRPTRAYGGHPVSYESYFLSADRIAELPGQAGLVVTARLVQQPGDGVKRPNAAFLARKPEPDPAAEAAPAVIVGGPP